METKNHKTESIISIPREKFLSIISQLQGENYGSSALNPPSYKNTYKILLASTFLTITAQ